MAFFEDNLLSVHGSLTHHGDQATVDEDLSPTLENTVVVLWLQLIHPGLPLLVKQNTVLNYAIKTLASLKPEISQTLGSLLDELRSIEDTKAMRIGSTTPRRHPNSGQGQPRRRPFLSCILCKTAGCPHNTHNVMDCRYLPDRDRRPWAR